MGSSRALHTQKYQSFLERLRTAREEAGLTQVEVAKALGRQQTFVSKCEIGERRVDFVELEEFAAVYRKPLSYFATAARSRGTLGRSK
jgi:transcriptional regulator with XRE-family HTH domain